MQHMLCQLHFVCIFYFFIRRAQILCGSKDSSRGGNKAKGSGTFITFIYIGNTAQAIEKQEEKWYNIVMNKQLTFSLISDEPAQTKTAKKNFLKR